MSVFRVRNWREKFRDRRSHARITGPSFDPALVTKRLTFAKQVLDSLIDRKALFQDAQKLKILAPDAYVASVIEQIPAFQQDGKFSPQRYEAVLRQNNRTPAQFESEFGSRYMLETVTSPASLAGISLGHRH